MLGTRRNLLLAAVLATGLIAAAPAAHAQVAQPHMQNAIDHLKAARHALNHAEANKGGHREKAIQFIDQAIQEVNLGIQYANQHPVKK